jgi:hypothetical protein
MWAQGLFQELKHVDDDDALTHPPPKPPPPSTLPSLFITPQAQVIGNGKT